MAGKSGHLLLQKNKAATHARRLVLGFRLIFATYGYPWPTAVGIGVGLVPAFMHSQVGTDVELSCFYIKLLTSWLSISVMAVASDITANLESFSMLLEYYQLYFIWKKAAGNMIIQI